MINKDVEDSAPFPISVKGLKELKLLEAELLARDAQLRNFSPLRDRLAVLRKNMLRRESVSSTAVRLSVRIQLSRRWRSVTLSVAG